MTLSEQLAAAMDAGNVYTISLVRMPEGLWFAVQRRDGGASGHGATIEEAIADAAQWRENHAEWQTGIPA